MRTAFLALAVGSGLLLHHAPIRAQTAAPDASSDVEAGLAPRLAWIAKEKMRGGYNYNASLEYFHLAQQCGMNVIISRLEIANEASGDQDRLATLPPDAPKSDAMRSYELIEPSARLAKQLGLHWFYMLNLAGSRGNYNDGVRDNPRRYNNGELPAPTDEVYWTRVVENRFLRVARMLQGDEVQIDGFLIDPEMYALKGATPGGPDFGDFALGEFLGSTGIKHQFRGLTIEQRRDWIRQQGLQEPLTDFQFERIRTMAQRTRERVQALQPDTLFGFFLWKNRLWYRAAAAGFATARTPCFVGPESTYPGGYSEQHLAFQDSARREAEVPLLFVPGLALSSEASAEALSVLKANLYHRSIRSQGYWFWALSRAFHKADERPPVLDMLSTVNAELDRFLASNGHYESPLRPARLPAAVPAHLQATLQDARLWRPLPSQLLAAAYPDATDMQLRGLHTLVALVDVGDQIRFRVTNVRLGRYTAPTAICCYRPDASTISLDDVVLGQSRDVVVDVDMAGAWVIGVTSHNNAFRIRLDSANTVLYGPEQVRGCRGGDQVFRYFFYVPKQAPEFAVKLRASQREPATFRLFGPEGRLVLERVKLGKEVSCQIEPTQLAGTICWLETSEIVEDHSFQLLGIPNLFAARPEQLLVPEL